MARKIEVEVVSNERGFKLGKTQSSLQKLGKAAGIAGLAITGGLVLAAKAGFDELAEAAKVGAQTEAVIKSTGQAANVTADQVSDLAESLMRKSGVDDEAIASGQNMLLTFKQIRNEAGKGNDIFDQATKATLNLSVAMGKDMSDSAIMVGKALNDPIKGITAMRRVGIQFTQAQEDQIKALVESGQVMKAQKVILKELESQFGGSAEAAGKTLPGQLNIAKESFSNLAGELTLALLPALTSVAQNLLRLAGFLSEHKTATKVAVVALAGLAAALMAFSVAVKVAAAGQMLLNIALVANPVGAVIVAVIALAAALVVAYKKSETFRAVVTGAINFVKRHWQLLLLALGPFGVAVLGIVRHFNTFKTAAQKAFGFAAASARSFASALQTVAGWVSTVVGWVNSAVAAVGRLANAIRSLPSLPSLPSIDLNPFRAMGGPVAAGVGHIVGERGPEWFTPRTSGTIIPNHALRGGGGGGSSGPPVQVNLMLERRVLASVLLDMDQEKRRRNGGRGLLPS